MVFSKWLSPWTILKKWRINHSSDTHYPPEAPGRLILNYYQVLLSSAICTELIRTICTELISNLELTMVSRLFQLVINANKLISIT